MHFEESLDFGFANLKYNPDAFLEDYKKIKFPDKCNKKSASSHNLHFFLILFDIIFIIQI